MFFPSFFQLSQTAAMSKRDRSTSQINSAKKTRDVPLSKRTHILDLNDDCLDSVFSYLLPVELCAVKGTCGRFEAVADNYFERQCRNKEFTISARPYQNFFGSIWYIQPIS